MAVHGQPEPPRTLAAWHRFQEECWRQQRYDWTGVAGLESHPYGFVPERWEFTAEDHPLKGTSFCWRCLTEAKGGPVGQAQHCRRYGVVCWGPPAPADTAANSQQDRRPPGDESSSDWTEEGRRYVAEALGGNQVIDTGTIFYDPSPPQSPAAPRGQVWLTQLDPEGRPIGSPVEAGTAWADDLSDVPEWPPPPVEIPLSKDEFEAWHGPVSEEVDES